MDAAFTLVQVLGYEVIDARARVGGRSYALTVASASASSETAVIPGDPLGTSDGLTIRIRSKTGTPAWPDEAPYTDATIAIENDVTRLTYFGSASDVETWAGEIALTGLRDSRFPHVRTFYDPTGWNAPSLSFQNFPAAFYAALSAPTQDDALIAGQISDKTISLEKSLTGAQRYEATQWRAVVGERLPASSPSKQRPHKSDVESLTYTLVLFDLWNRGIIRRGHGELDIARLKRILVERVHPADGRDVAFLESYAAPDPALARSALPIVAAADAASLGSPSGVSYDQAVARFLWDELVVQLDSGDTHGWGIELARGLGLLVARSTHAELPFWLTFTLETAATIVATRGEATEVAVLGGMIQGFVDVIPIAGWQDPAVLHVLLLQVANLSPAKAVAAALLPLISYYRKRLDDTSSRDWVARGLPPMLGVEDTIDLDFDDIYAALCELAHRAWPHLGSSASGVKTGLLGLLGPAPLSETPYEDLPNVVGWVRSASVTGPPSIAARTEYFLHGNWTSLLTWGWEESVAGGWLYDFFFDTPTSDETKKALRDYALLQLGVRAVLTDPDPEYRRYVGRLDLLKLDEAIDLGSRRPDWETLCSGFVRDSVLGAVGPLRLTTETGKKYEERISDRIAQLIKYSYGYLVSDAVGTYVRLIIDLGTEGTPAVIPFEAELGTMSVIEGVYYLLGPQLALITGTPPSVTVGKASEAARAALLTQRFGRDVIAHVKGLSQAQYDDLTAIFESENAKTLLQELELDDKWLADAVAAIRLIRALGKQDDIGIWLTGKMMAARLHRLPLVGIPAEMTDDQFRALKPYKAVFGAVGIFASIIQLYKDTSSLVKAMRTGSADEGFKAAANFLKHGASAAGDLFGALEVLVRAEVKTLTTQATLKTLKVLGAKAGIIDNALGVLLYGQITLQGAIEGDAITVLFGMTATVGSAVATLAYGMTLRASTFVATTAIEAAAAEALVAAASTVAGVASVVVAVGALGIVLWDHYKSDHWARAYDHMTSIGVLASSVFVVSKEPVPAGIRALGLKTPYFNMGDVMHPWEGTGPQAVTPDGLGTFAPEQEVTGRAVMVHLDTPGAAAELMSEMGETLQWSVRAPVTGPYLYKPDLLGRYKLHLDDSPASSLIDVSVAAKAGIVKFPHIRIALPPPGTGFLEDEPTEWLAVKAGDAVELGDVLLRNEGATVRAPIPGTIALTYSLSYKPAPGTVVLEIKR